MKTKLLTCAALLFSIAAFAQGPEAGKQKYKDNHGADVSAVAKSEIETGIKGEAVSAVASEKSQASSEARMQRKADRRNASADVRAETGNASDDDLLNAGTRARIEKGNKKEKHPNRSGRVKTRAKAGIDTQLSRPKVGAAVRGTAGLGIL